MTTAHGFKQNHLSRTSFSFCRNSCLKATATSNLALEIWSATLQWVQEGMIDGLGPPVHGLTCQDFSWCLGFIAVRKLVPSFVCNPNFRINMECLVDVFHANPWVGFSTWSTITCSEVGCQGRPRTPGPSNTIRLNGKCIGNGGSHCFPRRCFNSEVREDW